MYPKFVTSWLFSVDCAFKDDTIFDASANHLGGFPWSWTRSL